MNKTNIEWVKNPDGTQGFTWNPITGCLNGCEYCYARKLANTRLKELYLANLNVSEIGNRPRLTDPFYPRFWEDKIEQPIKQKKPAGIFVCNMGELFGESIPDQWTHSVLNFIEACPQHRFYLLTKQPQNLIKFSPFSDNAWVGVSATNQEQLFDALAGLSIINARVKFISFEPLLEGMNEVDDKRLAFIKAVGINWLIIGAQTKPAVYPKIEWVREIVKAADAAGIPVFLKDNLRQMIAIYPYKDVQWAWVDNGVNLRQEMPV